MKIAFFGQRKFFDYFMIGGFQSFIRRIALGLCHSGHQVDYLLYDAPVAESITVLPDLTLYYFKSFNEAFQKLVTGSYDHVFRVWLSRRDRLKYLFLQKAAPRHTTWHHLFLAWPESLIKRSLAVGEGWAGSRYGRLICVSPRQYRALSPFSRRACHILPPVPEDYFLSPPAKKTADPIKVTFLGNLTKDKYIEEIIVLFHNLQKHPQVHCSIYGTHDPLNPHSVEVHKRLQTQNDIHYVNIDMTSYSLETDTLVKTVLTDTDIFLQPYRTLHNTLDMPLLLLEAMAALCPVVTTPLGSVPEIYGPSKFIIQSDQFLTAAENLLKNVTSEEILLERGRIYERTQELNFGTTSIMEKFISLLKV
jgi:glycosyltransferase involved in cell wall biosynthesis